jgi:hypothetical protein
MAILLPANTIGQTWLPFLVSYLRERNGNYNVPMAVVFGIAMLGAVAILLLPRYTAAHKLGTGSPALRDEASPDVPVPLD